MRLKWLAPLLALSLAACEVLSPPTSQQTPSLPPAVTLGPPPPTPTYPATPPPTATFAPTGEPISALGLTGRLIFTQGLGGLWQVDLATGEEIRLWEIPENAYLAGVATSPDGAQLALTYSPPPPEGTPQLGSTSLFLADGDGANPQLLLEPTIQFESFISPAYLPDGQWLYYTHYQPVYDDSGTFSGLILNLERMPAQGGPSEVVIAGAQQGSPSPDGTQLIYLRFDLETYATGLWIANIDGTEARELVSDSAFFAMSGPHLSPDGTRVVFGASGPLHTAQAAQSGPAGVLARALNWLGTGVAEAHGPPWEVWQISVEGGQPEQLTELFTDGPWPIWLPDGESIVALQPGSLLLIGDGDPIYLGSALGHGEVVWAP